MMRVTCQSLFVGGMLLLAGPAAAQMPVAAGVKGGVAVSSLPGAGDVIDQIVGHSSTETSSKVGAAVAGFVQFGLRDRLFFQPELQFVMKGVHLNESANFGTVKVNINYLEFPLLMRYDAPLNDHCTAYVLVGPNLAVKAGTSGTLEGSSQTVDENIDPAIRTFDAGLTFGGGLEHHRYLLEARYTLGLTDIATEAYTHPNPLKNRSFAILAGVKFR